MISKGKNVPIRLNQCHVTHLPVDQRHSRWGFAQGEPFNHLCEFGWQSVWMAPVTTFATSQPGEAIASILGEPALRGPQRHAVMTGDVGQRHVVFHAGLEHPIALQCSYPLVGRQRRQRDGVLRLPSHRTLFYDKLPIQKYCRKDKVFGKVMQAPRFHFKRLAYATATPSTFVFGKVATDGPPSTSEEKETRPS